MSGAWSLAAMVDAVLAVTLIEAVVLLAWHRLTGRGLPARELLGTLAAGLCLMLALRAAVQGAAPVWVAACLMSAGLAHGLDLRRRWQRTEAPPTRTAVTAATPATAAQFRSPTPSRPT